MPFAISFDTETTDIPDWKAPSEGENQPHLVALAARKFNLESFEIVSTLDVIIRPEGWKSSPEAFEKHGITEEYAMDVGISESMAVGLFLEMWRGDLRIAYNTTFDNRLIRIAVKRYFGDEMADDWKAGPYECQMIAARKIMGGKNPTLQAAYQHFTGSELVGNHNALVDTDACLEIYKRIKELEQAA